MCTSDSIEALNKIKYWYLYYAWIIKTSEKGLGSYNIKQIKLITDVEEANKEWDADRILYFFLYLRKKKCRWKKLEGIRYYDDELIDP